MDYKTRHPNLNEWPHFIKLQRLEPWPFNIQGCEAHERLSPCETTTFLCCSGFLTANENHIGAYLVEASRHCPKRSSFEIGEMSRYDFWHNREWIIQVKFSLCDESYSRAEYIGPNQFCEMFKRLLNRKNDPCLFDQQLKALENSLEYNAKNPHIYSKLMREYQDFYRLYVSRMGHLAAS